MTPLVVSRPVREALAGGRPVVALETAVLTHGLPRPRNAEAFGEMVGAVEAHGAVAAPVAVLGGAVRVGVARDEWEALAGTEEGVAKVGLADLPPVTARGGPGGTTVAATLWAAWRTGIRVFATGGIGGVHRGADFDVSGDLAALARFSGCVVCSGAKVVLDLPRTLEVLDALGVCVLGFGSERLPAFVVEDSGLVLRHRCDTPEEVAAVVRARDGLDLPQAVVVANPPPRASAVPMAEVEEAVAGGLAAARRKGVAGPGVTPFLLRAVARATGGRTLAANRALLIGNAGLAARIAGALGRPPLR